MFNVTGGPDLSMFEVDEAAKIISSAANSDANIIFGAAIDDTMVDQVKITVIATGFSEAKLRSAEAREAAESLSTDSYDDTNSGMGEEKKEEQEDEYDIPAFMRQR